MLTEITSKGRKRMVISQQIMQLRIAKVEKLQEAYDASYNLLKENDSLPEAVKDVLRKGIDAAWTELNKMERKVIVGVQKKLPSDYAHFVSVFEANMEMWPNDPTLTILPDNDIETEEEDSENV